MLSTAASPRLRREMIPAAGASRTASVTPAPSRRAKWSRSEQVTRRQRARRRERGSSARARLSG